MKKTLLILSLLFISSCAQVRSVSQTSIPLKKDKPVKAEVTNNIFLLFNFSTTYVNDLTLQLQKSCPNGRVEGILTKDVLTMYFPIIFYRENITAEGYCVQ
jgi:hypothetical protein